MYAVITGDIIDSQKLHPQVRQQLYLRLDAFIKKLNKKDIKGEVYQGDSFQCLVLDATKALRYALILKTFLRSFSTVEIAKTYSKAKNKNIEVQIPKTTIDAKIALGIGTVEFLNTKLKTSDGEAFVLAGRLLKTMESNIRTLSAEINLKNINDELKATTAMIDFIISRATPKQSLVVFYKLFNKTENEIGELMKINQSAVNQHSRAVGWFAIDIALKRYEILTSKL